MEVTERVAIQGERFFSLQEICVLLNIAPRTFRQLLREYAGLLEWEVPADQDMPRGLPAEVFDRFRTIVEMRAAGRDFESIKRAVLREREVAEPPLPRTPPVADVSNSVVIALLRELSDELKQAEERWGEERERILTALIRVQQELQSLRYELASHTSRRERKRKSFWASLLGL